MAQLSDLEKSIFRSYDISLGYAGCGKQKQSIYHRAAISFLFYPSSTTPATRWLPCDLQQTEGPPSAATDIRCPETVPTSAYHSS